MRKLWSPTVVVTSISPGPTFFQLVNSSPSCRTVGVSALSLQTRNVVLEPVGDASWRIQKMTGSTPDTVRTHPSRAADESASEAEAKCLHMAM